MDTYTSADLKCQGIYAIVNTLTGRVYIGQTMKAFEKRWFSHRVELNRGRHCNIELQQDWNELGERVFQFTIVHKFSGLNSAYQMSLESLERVMIVTAECWLYNATKRRLYSNDQERISWLYTRRWG